MAEKPPSLRMVGPADYGLRAGRVGVLKREHQRRLSALTRLVDDGESDAADSDA